MKEEWKTVVGFKGLYAVSNLGRIKSFARTVEFIRCGELSSASYSERILKLVPDVDGHLTVFLSKDGIKNTRRVHSLVAEAFLGPRPFNKGACHKDDIKTNNCVSNLYYGTQKENMLDSIRNGRAPRGVKHGRTPLKDADVRKIRTLRGKITIRDLGKMFGVAHQSIQAILDRKTWRHIQEVD